MQASLERIGGILEIPGIVSPVAYAMGMIRYRYRWAMTKLPADELLGVALVAMWEETLNPPIEGEEPIHRFRRAVNREIERYFSALGLVNSASRKRVNPPLSQDGEDDAWWFERISAELTSGEAPLIEGRDLFAYWWELVEGILLAGSCGRHPEQGERDLKVFTLYLEGKDAEEIAAECEWLKPSSAYDAVERIVLKLREQLGGDATALIAVGGKRHAMSKSRGRTMSAADKRSYTREYYLRNKERINTRVVENRRAKRKKTRAEFDALFESPDSSDEEGDSKLLAV